MVKVEMVDTGLPQSDVPYVMWFVEDTIYGVVIDLVEGVKIVDVVNKKAYLTDAKYTDLLKPFIVPVAIIYRDRSNIKIRVVCAPEKKYRIADVIVDLKNKRCSLNTVKEFNFDWVTGWGHLHRGVVLDRTLLVTDDNGYAHYVDLVNGTDDSWDTGLGEYTLRLGLTYVHKQNDIKMLTGRHYAGDVFRVLSVYQKKITELSVSAGGGSPAVNGITTRFIDEDLLIGNGSDVVEQVDSIVVFDSNFNHKFTVDVKKLTGLNYPDTNQGFILFGRSTVQGKKVYHWLIASRENIYGSMQPSKLVYAEIDEEGNIINKVELLSMNTIWINFSMCTGGARGYSLPILDFIRKRMYMVVFVQDSKGKRLFIADVDLSDVLDKLDEVTSSIWIAQRCRIPTVLSLMVRTL